MKAAAIAIVAFLCISHVNAAGSIHLPFPNPPFDLSDYPIKPVKAFSGREWAEGVFGLKGWSCRSQTGDNFNRKLQSMEGVEEGGLWGVICDGPTSRLRTISYACVGGPAAKYVDVNVYPPPTGRDNEYLGWNGKSFRVGPAVETNGFYWYRLAVEWIAPFKSPTGVFFAKTYRHPNDGSDKSFKLWAFTE